MYIQPKKIMTEFYWDIFKKIALWVLKYPDSKGTQKSHINGEFLFASFNLKFNNTAMPK